jgi:hypothetical protein
MLLEMPVSHGGKKYSVSGKSFDSPASRQLWQKLFSSVLLRSNVVTIDINYLFQSFDSVQKNGSDYVDFQIRQNIADGLEIILHLNEGSSCEFAFEQAEEEKVGWCDILVGGRMKSLLEFKLCHLLQIGLKIVRLDIADMEQREWYPIFPPSCLKHGCKLRWLISPAGAS